MADLLRDDHALDTLVGQAAASIISVSACATTSAVVGSAAAYGQCDAAEVLRRVVSHADSAQLSA
jgi:ApbE superfamily uncharacterized protein (UPF0280 family)